MKFKYLSHFQVFNLLKWNHSKKSVQCIYIVFIAMFYLFSIGVNAKSEEVDITNSNNGVLTDKDSLVREVPKKGDDENILQEYKKMNKEVKEYALNIENKIGKLFKELRERFQLAKLKINEIGELPVISTLLKSKEFKLIINQDIENDSDADLLKLGIDPSKSGFESLDWIKSGKHQVFINQLNEISKTYFNDKGIILSETKNEIKSLRANYLNTLDNLNRNIPDYNSLNNFSNHLKNYIKSYPALESILGNQIKDFQDKFKNITEEIQDYKTEIEKGILLDSLIEQTDNLRKIFELAMRLKWSEVLDRTKVADRFFLPNFSLKNSVLMLKSNTTGEITQVKEVLYKQSNGELVGDSNSESTVIKGKRMSKVYYLKVNFMICKTGLSTDECENEELWVTYEPIQYDNLKLFSITSTLTDSDDKTKVDNVTQKINVGDRITILEDGVTAFTEEPEFNHESNGQESNGNGLKESKSSEYRKLLKNDEMVKADSKMESHQLQGNEADDIQYISLYSRTIASSEGLGLNKRSNASGLITLANGFAATCQEYIKKDGYYGVIGKAIKSKIKSNTTNILFSNDIGDLKQISKICPNYENMELEEKQDFLIYFGASIAMAESACNSKITAKGPNGTLIGQWQLHLGKEDKYAGGVCKNINSRDGSQNVVCGLKMLNYYTDKSKTPKNKEQHLFYKGNYWETMHYPRPGAKAALRLIRKYKACEVSS